jgi:hypothetical protein
VEIIQKQDVEISKPVINKGILAISIVLISFGSVNIINNVFTQPSGEISVRCFDSEGNQTHCAKPMDLFVQNILE